jgi:hypothetical protein
MMSSSFESKFQPYNFGDNVEAIVEIQNEMRSIGSEVFSLYFDSVAGYENLSKHFEEWKKERQDALAKIGVEVDDELWSDLESFPVHPPHGHQSNFDEFVRPLSGYRARLKTEGRNALLIGNYLLIALYQHWEDSWRSKIARALKTDDRNSLVSDYWGDLRLIRICLIHKRGIADSDVANKSRIYQWFKEGDPIFIDGEKIKQIIAGYFTFLYGELVEYGRKLKK